jgi:hypothetical protein
MGVLCGARSILHINEKAGRFGGTEEYIASLTKLLSPLGIDSHLIYDQLHGESPSPIRSRRKIPGLADRDAREDVSRRVLQTVSRINPDVVYVHNIVDGRVIQALDTPERKYAILWYVHDHYPTGLTELRALAGRSAIICLEPFSEACSSSRMMFLPSRGHWRNCRQMRIFAEGLPFAGGS